MLGLCVFVIIAGTLHDIGWTWDEVYYFMSSELQMEWLRAFFASVFSADVKSVLSQEVVDSYWLWDLSHNPHPPLYRILSGTGWALFRETLGDFVAYRLASALLASVLIACVFLSLQETYGRLPALYGSLCLLLMPRFFGHAHLAATEANRYKESLGRLLITG